MFDDGNPTRTRRVGVGLVVVVLSVLVALEIYSAQDSSTGGGDRTTGLVSPLSILAAAAVASIVINRAVRRHDAANERPRESAGPGSAPDHPTTSFAAGDPRPEQMVPGRPATSAHQSRPEPERTSELSEATVRNALSMLDPSEREALIDESGYVGPPGDRARIDLRRGQAGCPTCGRRGEAPGRRCQRRHG